MPAFQNTYFSKVFTVKNSAGVALDVSSWLLHVKFRQRLTDTTVLLDLTTAGGGMVITNGVAGQMELRISAAQTALLPVGKVVFDVLRTDISPGPVYVFSGVLPVKMPVTRP